MAEQLPSLAERSKPYSMYGEPPCPHGPLTCPECGAVKKYGDMEGACGCENGHSWWDTNSPEYVEMRRVVRAASETL